MNTDRLAINFVIVATYIWLMTWAKDAKAQHIANDPVNYAAKLQQIAKDAAEFDKDTQRWQETASRDQQQLIKLQRTNFGQTKTEDSFPLHPRDYGMKDMGRGPGRDIKGQLTSAFRQAMPKLDGNVADEQQAICQRLVYTENAKYNESVNMLRTLMQRSREFARTVGQHDTVSNNDNEAYTAS